MPRIQSNENARPTLRFAPDYLVFINGAADLNNSFEQVTEDGVILTEDIEQVLEKLDDVVIGLDSTISLSERQQDFQRDIQNISISHAIGSPPGTASFSISAPRGVKKGYFINEGEVTERPKITQLSEVQIFAKGRFLVNDLSDSPTPDESIGEPRYYRVFWGLVTEVVVDEGVPVRSINVSCNGILWWWGRNFLALNPGAFDQQILGKRVTAFANIFESQNPYEIIYKVATLYGDGDIVAAQNVTGAVGDRTVGLQEQIRTAEAVRAYWRKRFKAIGDALRMFGYRGVAAFGINNRFEPNGSDEFKNDKLPSGIQAVLKELDSDIISTFAPFATVSKGINGFESTLQSKLEFSKMVADLIGYELFMQTTGEIVFKPPFYNVDPKEYKPFVITTSDIKTVNHRTSANSVFTRVEVYGQLHKNIDAIQGSGAIQTYGYFNDYRLMTRFGLHPIKKQARFLHTSLSCFYYAITEMARINAGVETLSLTLVFRPELRLGYPIYVEHLDLYGYVEAINHSVTARGVATTTVQLSAVRSPKYKQMLINAQGLDRIQDNQKYMVMEIDNSNETDIEKAMPFQGAISSKDRLRVEQAADEMFAPISKILNDTIKKVFQESSTALLYSQAFGSGSFLTEEDYRKKAGALTDGIQPVILFPETRERRSIFFDSETKLIELIATDRNVLIDGFVYASDRSETSISLDRPLNPNFLVDDSDLQTTVNIIYDATMRGISFGLTNEEILDLLRVNISDDIAVENKKLKELKTLGASEGGGLPSDEVLTEFLEVLQKNKQNVVTDTEKVKEILQRDLIFASSHPLKQAAVNTGRAWNEFRVEKALSVIQRDLVNKIANQASVRQVLKDLETQLDNFTLDTQVTDLGIGGLLSQEDAEQAVIKTLRDEVSFLITKLDDDLREIDEKIIHFETLRQKEISKLQRLGYDEAYIQKDISDVDLAIQSLKSEREKEGLETINTVYQLSRAYADSTFSDLFVNIRKEEENGPKLESIINQRFKETKDDLVKSMLARIIEKEESSPDKFTVEYADSDPTVIGNPNGTFVLDISNEAQTDFIDNILGKKTPLAFFPVSDKQGYEIISGIFPYGLNIKIAADGFLLPIDADSLSSRFEFGELQTDTPRTRRIVSSLGFGFRKEELVGKAVVEDNTGTDSKRPRPISIAKPPGYESQTSDSGTEKLKSSQQTGAE